MSMTVKEFKEQIKGLKKVNDAELKIHTESGDYEVSGLEFSKSENALKVCTMDEARKQVFRISYIISKDHRTYSVNTVRRTLESEDDIILNIEDWQKGFLKDAGIEGEESEKTGSTIVSEKEQKIEIDPNTEKAKLVEKDVDHYYNCHILEVFKELDADNDIYIRVWKNGNVG